MCGIEERRDLPGDCRFARTIQPDGISKMGAPDMFVEKTRPAALGTRRTPPRGASLLRSVRNPFVGFACDDNERNAG